MNPEFIHRNALTILGFQIRVERGKETPELFQGVWSRFEQARADLQSRAVGTRYYGVNFPTGEETVSDYLAGMEVKEDSDSPGGAVKRRIPEGDYAVFPCEVDEIGAMYQYIFGTWMPGATRAFDPRNPVFEEYPEADSHAPVRIHLPVAGETL